MDEVKYSIVLVVISTFARLVKNLKELSKQVNSAYLVPAVIVRGIVGKYRTKKGSKSSHFCAL